MRSRPIINILHQSDTFITTDDYVDMSLSPKVRSLHYGALVILYV